MTHIVATGQAALPAVHSMGSVFDDAAAIVSCYPFGQARSAVEGECIGWFQEAV